MPENDKTLLVEFVKSHASEAAKVLEECDEQAIGNLIEELPSSLAGAVLSAMDAGIASRCIERLNTDDSSRILSHMTIDSSDLLMRRIEPARRSAIFASFPPELRSAYEIRIQYPPFSAGSLMDPLAPTLSDDITVKEAHRLLRKLPDGLVYHVFVVSRNKRLSGFVTLRQLMTTEPRERVQTVMQGIDDFLLPEMSRATILAHPAWKNHPILPVTTQEGIFLGAVSFRTLRLLEEVDNGRLERGRDTGTALGELYWLGLTAMFKGAVSSLKGKED